MGIKHHIFPHTWNLEIHIITYNIKENGDYLERGRDLVKVWQNAEEGHGGKCRQVMYAYIKVTMKSVIMYTQ